MVRFALTMVTGLLIGIALLGCSRRTTGKVVGSRSQEGWSGPAWYLLIENDDGQHWISVTRERYMAARDGDDFTDD